MDKRSPVAKVPFFLVTGFLGSGKTTLLTELIRRYSQHYRIAVVQNEFAPGHVDGQMLREVGKPFQLMEINNGSVFCACLLSDFIDRLDAFLKEARPDVIFLEATGLADPVSLGEILQSPQVFDHIYLAGSWCIVDARNFFPIVDQVFQIRHQVSIADLIWINKTDLISEIEPIEKRLRELNPYASILSTRFGNTTQIELENHFFNVWDKIPVNEPVSKVKRPAVGACVVRSNYYFDRQKVTDFIHQEAAHLYRMKGFIKISPDLTLAIQTVNRDVEIREWPNHESGTEVIALGPDLIPAQFSKKFLSLKQVKSSYEQNS